MTLPDINALYAVVEATWPPAKRTTTGPWTIRNGKGGGKRVSAATADAYFNSDDISIAEAEMATLNQPTLFMIRENETRLDQMLSERGYVIIDPVLLYACTTERLTREPLKPVSGFAVWPPLEIMKEIWATGGIEAGRLAVMDRAASPKTGILARAADRAAGCAFVSIHESIAMIHAIEVTPSLRRNGAGLNMLRHAAHWAQNQGADSFSLVVTDANTAANGLYKKLGMTPVGRYHYRIRQQ